VSLYILGAFIGDC